MNSKIDKKDIYILLVIVIGSVIGASALIYYMSDPLTIVPLNTKELTVTQMEFTTSSDSDIIILHVTSSGTSPVTVGVVRINGDKITGDSIHGLTFEPGDSGTITIEHEWITGNSYTARLFASDGSLVGSYTDTA